MKVSIVIGTRPEIIKMSPIINFCEEFNIDYFVLHTEQHHSPEMSDMLIKELDLPPIKYYLRAHSRKQGQQTGKMLAKIEEILLNDIPDVILVQGDTNTALAGALAACKLNVKIGHVEAGLRSFDNTMTEEINRVIIDHISDYLFAPTEISRQHLINEGIPEKQIYMTGNTIVDVLQKKRAILKSQNNIIDKFELERDKYFVATLHRAETVDDHIKLKDVLEAFRLIYQEFKMPICFPIHPRTTKMIKESGYDIPAGTLVMEPLGHQEFLQLLCNSKMILSDSGGLQEEACILGVACVTLRSCTERPETVDMGANILAGTDVDKIVDAVKNMIHAKCNWDNPYGDGKTSKRIMETLEHVHNHPHDSH